MIAQTETQWQMKPNIPLALQLTKRGIPALVYDAVNLEGVAMTLPEVQTLLDGITVDGHRLSDQNMALNQGKAWAFVFSLVEQGKFQFNKETALKIHAISSSEYEPPVPDELDIRWSGLSYC